jgi:hypothetical protein
MYPNSIEPKHVTFDQAKWLKDIGFNKRVITYSFEHEEKKRNDLGFLDHNKKCKDYFDKYSIPEQHEVVDWLLENYQIFIEVNPNWNNGKIDYFDATIYGKSITDVLCGKKTLKQAYSSAIDYIKVQSCLSK